MATKNARRGRPASTELTDKQTQVIALAQEGLTAKEAAARLGIAESGVYNHVTRIRQKGHAIEFATATGTATAAVAAEAAPTNGGALPTDADMTTAAKQMLGADAGKYLSALSDVQTACINRRAEIEREMAALREEDSALGARVEELAKREADAKRVVEQIEALA